MSRPPVRIAVAAGGTGGHVRPALAVAEAVVARSPGAELLFLTDGRRVAERFFAGVSEPRVALFDEAAGAPRARDLPAWWRAFGRARRALRAFRPDVLIGAGGYPTFVAGLAALGPLPIAALRVARGRAAEWPRFVLLEQNALPGRAVRRLARSATAVLLALPEAAGVLPPGTPLHVIGNPLPATFLAAPEVADRAAFGLAAAGRVLVGLGGSQGARGLNRMLLAARPLLAARHPDLQILLLAGEGEADGVRAEVATTPGPPTVVLSFETRMRQVYALADVVVARAGGTTLAELAVAGRAAVLVPYPYGDRHQFANARVFEAAGAAQIVPEGEDGPARLAAALAGWLGDGAALSTAAAAAAGLARPDAAQRAADLILALVERPS